VAWHRTKGADEKALWADKEAGQTWRMKSKKQGPVNGGFGDLLGLACYRLWLAFSVERRPPRERERERERWKKRGRGHLLICSVLTEQQGDKQEGAAF